MKKKILILSIIYLVTFGLLLGAYSLYVKNEVADAKNVYQYIAKDKADHIATKINNVVLRTSVLNALIQDHNGGTEFFEAMADDIYANVLEEAGISLDYIAVAPDGIIDKIYPYENNEDMIGYDLMDVTKPGNIQSKEVYQFSDTILTHYYDIHTNSVGITSTTPIYIKSGQNSWFWGIVSLRANPQNFIDALKFSAFEEMGINYQLCYIDSHNTKHIITQSDTPLLDEVTYEFPVENLTWSLSICPAEGWYSYKNIHIVIIVFLAISTLISLFTNMLIKIREKNLELWKISNIDKLTECYNRRAYEEKLKDISKSEMCKDLVYIAIDINGLKKANDNLGHEAGDELIKGASNCLKNCFKEYGNIFRTGGDEFVGIVCCDENTLSKCKETLDRSVDKWKGEFNISLSMSKGYAPHCEFPELNINELAKIADQRMYEDKRNFYIKSGQDRRNR